MNTNLETKAHPAYQVADAARRPVFTRSEAAYFMGISERHLQRLGLPRIKIGRRVLYRVETLLDYLDARTEKPLSALQAGVGAVMAAHVPGVKDKLSREDWAGAT